MPSREAARSLPSGVSSLHVFFGIQKRACRYRLCAFPEVPLSQAAGPSSPREREVFRSNAMAAVSVTNDLQAPLEVKFQSEEWRVVYPKRSCSVEASEALIQVRLRESPEVTGSCQASGGTSFQASVDFGAFSQRCKGRDRAEARELAREGNVGKKPSSGRML